MAGSKTNSHEDAVLNTARGTTLTAWTAYVGLFTAAPGEAGGGTEVTGNAYARQAVTFGAPSGGSMSNSSDITFPVATPAGWGTITDFAIFDNVSGGTMRYYGTLTTSKTVAAGDQFKFATGALTVSED